ncbi:MAG: hypothetical protein RR293_04270 [Bacteroidales bacterium]
MVRNNNSGIEKIREDAVKWSEMCGISGIGYGIFFFERENSVTGGANLNVGEIALILERISRSLSHTEIRLLIDILKK